MIMGARLPQLASREGGLDDVLLSLAAAFRLLAA